MKRRKVIKIVAGALAAGSAGVVTLANAFEPEHFLESAPKKIALNTSDTNWSYVNLDPRTTAKIAYKNYNVGSCMYGVFSSIITQLAIKIGEPFSSFPIHMMKYGHGGIGGAGTICGTLNGATAAMGLLINDKKTRDTLTADLFKWYESTEFPTFKPDEPDLDFIPPTSISESVLCHVSATKWGKSTGFKIATEQKKERCKRLTADVAAQTVAMLNSYFDNSYVTKNYNNKTVETCLACHGKEGKLGNTSGKMNCTSCHDSSLAHKLFGKAHYKLMDEN